jgi:hypothetical protein
MKVTEKDEDLHLGEADPAVNWMENLCFFSYDEERQAGFLVHMKNRPNQGVVEFRLAANVGGKTVTHLAVHPINGGFAYPGFTFDCVEADRRWVLKLAGSGWPIEQVGNVVGMPVVETGPIPFALDLTWTATIDSLDWLVMKDNASADAPGGRHYDQGGRISGTIRVGDAEAQVDALAYRDHSWGPRNFMQMKLARFIGFVAEDMRTYFDGHLIDFGGEQGVHGFAYTVEDGQGTMKDTPVVTILEGEDWDHGYRKVAIDTDGTRYVANTLWNIAMPLVPERYLSNIAMVRVELPGGRNGFGIVERGRLFTDEDLAAWQAAARAPAAG